MENAVEYHFETEMSAYRFLNTVKHIDAEGLKVKFGRSDHHVSVKYRYVVGVFDSTLSTLDDLARELGGEEVA
ncbi:hypothetical protein [Alteromonas mediterranea]|jgi:hypothetical protein|uniref:Uncharacterized protein n=2 Tax=Alteromonas mediterranea TaxID=314275 RepID=S5AHZ7_9ALTE|nr:hypothetical protein [Alteromonas mediterranea]AGP78386.1 hypothetical protein I633_12480 [Alteromonas mediterranea 615]AGP94027.1 hypothetical protein I634_11620 [Alteromonas mediterranea U8]MBR9782931.1 hypothetical protein [Gammaproteobacteria bacterium]MDY6884595.1 hypothetical protein [Pseudomonadota bacterium]AEA98457.1 hypothetical protein MADE_1011605 [Alteromonas mediterranea DE]|tara:strand:+ start:520 stop:738 length:219 start_codon:yes stop_codon:yes gene_type:complete